MKDLEFEAYCVKCKENREMVDIEIVTMKNGRKAAKGSCTDCECGMFRILGKKDL
jgi:hypothetical protein